VFVSAVSFTAPPLLLMLNSQAASEFAPKCVSDGDRICPECIHAYIICIYLYLLCMYVCMCSCVCVCVCIYHIYTYICIYVYMYIICIYFCILYMTGHQGRYDCLRYLAREKVLWRCPGYSRGLKVNTEKSKGGGEWGEGGGGGGGRGEWEGEGRQGSGWEGGRE
jgi:uncharacterized membrane protein YgcG